MKRIIKTEYGSQLNLQLAQIKKTDDKIVITQIGKGNGFFIEKTAFEISQLEDKIIYVDKNDLQKALSVTTNPEFKLTKASLVISENNTKIKVKLVNDVSWPKVNEIDLSKAIDLPKNFINKFNRASQFTSHDDKRIILGTINFEDGNLYATDGYSLITIVVDNEFKGSFNIPCDLLKIFPNPQKLMVQDDKVIFANDTQIAKLTQIEGKFPEIERLLQGQLKDSTKVEVDHLEFENAIDTALKLDVTNIMLDKDAIVDNVNGTIETKIKLDLDKPRTFSTSLLKRVLNKGEIAFSNDAMISTTDEETALILRKRSD